MRKKRSRNRPTSQYTLYLLGFVPGTCYLSLKRGWRAKNKTQILKTVFYRVFRRINESCIYLKCAWHTVVRAFPSSYFLRQIPTQGWRDGSAVKNTCCSYRGPSTQSRQISTCNSTSRDLPPLAFLDTALTCTYHLQAHTYS